jgi:hypothetical protein
MFGTAFGLPMHPLVVHATVVVVPAAALAVLAASLWPRFRRWAGLLPLALAAAAVVLVPISTSSGESLEETVRDSSLVEKHAELADALLPWVIALTITAALGWYVSRRPASGRRRVWIVPALMTASLIAASGTIVEVALIGHSGAKAAWFDVEKPVVSGER